MLFINIVFRDSICVWLSEWKITQPSFNHLIYFPTQKSQKDQRNDLIFFACIKEVFPHVFKSLVNLMFSKYPYVFIILEVSTFKLTFVWFLCPFPGHIHHTPGSGHSVTQALTHTYGNFHTSTVTCQAACPVPIPVINPLFTASGQFYRIKENNNDVDEHKNKGKSQAKT